MKKIFLALLLLCPLSASAWSSVGHKVVIEVAKRHLTDKAREGIAALMPYDITEDAAYMDYHRKDEDLLYAFHYHELCINLETLEYDPNPHAACGDMMRGLRIADYNLSHRHNCTDSVAVLSMRMLIHFVGELHCPVHLGIPSIWQPKPPYRKDFRQWYWKGENVMSFHNFIDYAPARMFEGMTPAEAAEAIDVVSRREAAGFVKGDFVDWANDSVKSGFRIYDYFPPLWEIPDTEEPKTIPDDYLDKVWDILKYELVKGGYQLASLLNGYFK